MIPFPSLPDPPWIHESPRVREVERSSEVYGEHVQGRAGGRAGVGLHTNQVCEECARLGFREMRERDRDGQTAQHEEEVSLSP